MNGRIAVLAAIILLGSVVAGLPAVAAQDDQRLDHLFAELQDAGDKKAKKIENDIWTVWHESGSEMVDLLMMDAREAINMGLHDQAEEQYDAVVDLAPEFAEGWNRRATLRFMRGNYEGSIKDIIKVLELEPRHFGALSGLGMIYDRMGEQEAALKAFEEALLINPHLDEVRKRADAIRKALKDKEI